MVVSLTTIKELIAEWNEVCDIEKDVHVAISGDEGDGKSHLLVNIVKRMGGNLWDNIIYTGNPQEYYDKYENLGEKAPIGFDEALELIDRINWAKNDVKDLVKHVRSRVRKEKRAVFLYNVQLFRDLHGYWRNHRIRYWIELPNREWFDGLNMAFIYKKSRVPFITGRRDAWLLDKMETEWLKTMRQGGIEGTMYIGKLKSHPFYQGEFIFKGLPVDVGSEYLKRREEAYDTYRIVPDEKPSTKYEKVLEERNRAFDILNEFFSQKEISDRIGLHQTTVSFAIKQARKSDRIYANKHAIHNNEGLFDE